MTRLEKLNKWDKLSDKEKSDKITIELYKKTQRKLLVCPDCASSEIEFKVWYDPNDRKSTAWELDDGELEDGWCHSCNDEISHCVESKESIDETN